MTALAALVKRNIKLYFKDKGMFFSSLITPVILLVLYATFLKKVYDDSFRAAVAAAGATVSDKLLNGCVGGQLRYRCVLLEPSHDKGQDLGRTA